MFELLTLGGVLSGLELWALWGFWVVAVVVLLVYIQLTENENWGWATTGLVTILAGLWITGVFNIWKYTINHPFELLRNVGGYVLCGVIWATYKWYKYCKKRLARYEEAKADFLRSRGATELTPVLRVEWTEHIRQARSSYEAKYRDVDAVAPLAKNNKEKICNWMYLWPFSIAGFVLSDFVRKFWNWMYERVGKLFDNISKAVWKDTSNDLASEQDIAAARELAAQQLANGINARAAKARGSASF